MNQNTLRNHAGQILFASATPIAAAVEFSTEQREGRLAEGTYTFWEGDTPITSVVVDAATLALWNSIQ